MVTNSSFSGKEYVEGGRSIRLDFKSFISLIFIKGCRWTQAISLTWSMHNGPEERLIRKEMHSNAFLTWIIYWRQNCWLWGPKISWLTVSLFLERSEIWPQNIEVLRQQQCFWGHYGLAIPRKVSLITAVINHEAEPPLSPFLFLLWSQSSGTELTAAWWAQWCSFQLLLSRIQDRYSWICANIR